MKRFNKNIIVFVVCFLFIGLGFSVEYLNAFKYDTAEFLFSDLIQKKPDCLADFFKKIDDTSSKKLRYHDELMDLNAIKQVALNTQIVPKGDTTIVKTDSGSLICPQNQFFPEDGLVGVVENIDALRRFTQENGGEFLYVAAPRKTLAMAVPENVIDYEKVNYDRLISALEEKDIPTLDLTARLAQEGMLNKDAFFVTDHHWKPETGFWATGEICKALNSHYDFAYNESYTNLDNYTVKTYEDWFLGSHGKKVGRTFIKEGPDDFSLITPLFETDMTEERPLKNQIKTGSFEETVLFTEHLSEKDHYRINTYDTYSGGNHRLQIMKNNANQDGAKVLMIIDSYACVVSPFLSLNTAELHIIDTRDFLNSEKISVYSYIEEMQPDYVLMFYSGNEDPPDGQGRYDFE